MPALAAAYDDPLTARVAAIDAMLTIEPPPLAISVGITALEQRYTLLRLMRITRSQLSSDASQLSARSGGATPALFTSTSTVPKRAIALDREASSGLGADVAHDELRLSARLVYESGGLLAADVIEVGDHDVGAFTRRAYCDRATESGTSSGDDHDSSVESHVDAPAPRCQYASREAFR